MAFDDIPEEIKNYPQWITWEYRIVTEVEKNTGNIKERVTKVPTRADNAHNASVTNPLDWTTFERAKNAALSRNCGIGFVFTKSDPFVGIDLDDPAGGEKPLLPEQQQIVSENHRTILSSINSYTECSPSGKGIHIIAKAVLLGPGRRQNKVEIYDNERFFTFTGNVYNFSIIQDAQNEVVSIYGLLGSSEETAKIEYVSAAQTYSDESVFEHARTAANGEKFLRLWNGDWQTDYGQKSQSEADFALINIIGFYSRNLEQTVRIFRQSGLGQRPKAKRGAYVTNMAKAAFDRFIPVVNINIGWSFDATKVEPWIGHVPLYAVEPAQWIPHVGPVTEPAASPTGTALQGGITHSASAPYAPSPEHVNSSVSDGRTQALASFETSYAVNDPGRPLDEFPEPVPPIRIPGMVGELVDQCWHSAPFQVAEVAIASALSTMSLLTARTYRHGSIGLSLYLMLLAKTSVGKSFMYSANDKWFNQLLHHYRNMPGAMKRAGDDRAKLLSGMIIGEVGSAQGLQAHIGENPALLIHADEYVEHIRMMAQPNPPPHLAQIRAELLKLMEMAGPGRIYRGRKYSKRSNTPESVDVLSASLSILASGTPEQFYDELTPTLLTSGFLPRFTILEYEGGISKRNMHIRDSIDPKLFNNISYMFDVAYNKSLNITGDKNDFIDVQPVNQTAAEYLTWFDNICTREAQNANDVGSNMAGMWSRAKEHMRQIACLIAIGRNPHVPTIDVGDIEIAIKIIRPSIDKIGRVVIEGEIGNGDDRLEAEIKKFIRKMADGWHGMKGYPGINKDLIQQGYFQSAAVRNYCMHLASFKQHRLGSSVAFENTMNSLIKYGVVKPVDVNMTSAHGAKRVVKCIVLGEAADF